MTTPIEPDKPAEPAAGSQPRGAKEFDSYMQRGASDQGQGMRTQGSSPMDIAQGARPPGAPPTMDSIQAQAKNVQDGLGTVEKQLSEPKLKLKRSQAHLLKNKLTDASEHIRQSAAKVGVQAPPMKTPLGKSAIGRFVAYVNDGQDQLIQVQDQLKKMAAKGQQLNAADMLSVTVKMNLAQQEIEYSTTLLGKVMDSIKQVMNIQL